MTRWVLTLFLCLGACAPASTTDPAPDRAPHIVILMADDLGTDVAPCHADTVRMPHLQSLCEDSIVFQRAYTHPVCTPSRATLFTSRHPFQHGANDVRQAATKLDLAEITFLERLKRADTPAYQTAGFGKWHLGDDENGDKRSPNLQGFDHFEGTPRQQDTYKFWNYSWWRNGEQVEQSVATYRPTYIVDRVLAYFGKVSEARPQLLYVSFTSPHLPFHAPPEHLHSIEGLTEPPKRGPLNQAPAPGYYQANRRDPRLDPYYFAMLEALDLEIARLTTGLERESDRPIIFMFAGDNGTSAEVYQGDLSAGYRAKGMLYDGGARVPVQIWSTGPESKLLQRETDQLFHFADFGPTILDLAGLSSLEIEAMERETHGVSQAGVLRGAPDAAREYVYLERGTPGGAPYAFGAVDENGMKLVLWADPEARFPALEGFQPDRIEVYDTETDPNELENLFATCAAEFAIIRNHLSFIDRTISGDITSTVPFDFDVFADLMDEQEAACGARAL